MAITFNFEVDSKPNKKGSFGVYIRITENRKKKRVKTSIALRRLSDWNKDKQAVRASEPNAKAWNKALELELERAKATFRELQSEGIASASAIVGKLRQDEAKPMLLAYSENVRSQLLAEGKLGSWQKYGTFINLLKGFLADKLRREDIPFCEVTPDFVEGFKSYMNTLQNHRAKKDESGERPEMRLNPNTITKNLKIFRAIVNKAINIEGFLKAEANPFRGYKLQEIPVRKERLEADELGRLIALELEEGSAKWHARNAFLFSFYCAGIRAGDLMQLRWCNVSSEGRLSYQMGKNHKLKDIVLVEPAKNILKLYKKADSKPSDYIFPYLNNRAAYAKAANQEGLDSMPVELKQALYSDIHNSNIQINRRLQDIMQLAGISKHISFHISRHTFAKQAKLAGTDNAILKSMLAHSSLGTTERYMGEFDTSRQDEALQRIFQANTGTKPAESSKEALISALKQLDDKTLAEIFQSLSRA